MVVVENEEVLLAYFKYSHPTLILKINNMHTHTNRDRSLVPVFSGCYNPKIKQRAR